MSDTIQLCRHGWNPAACDDCVEPVNSEANGEGMSVPDDTMDTMIQRASVPNLATLFQRGKDAGLLKPTTGYGG